MTAVSETAAIPDSFRHRELLLHGRPRHKRFDEFWRKHPPMDIRHRAKIFSPFDALAGFDDCISSKNLLYCERKILSESEQEDLDQKLSLLHNLTYCARSARENSPHVNITCYSPCTDMNSDWFGLGGQYKTVTGIVKKVDALISMTITVDDRILPLDDIVKIELLT